MRPSLTARLMRSRRLLVLGSALAAAVAGAVSAVRRRRQIARADGAPSLTGVPALALGTGDHPPPNTPAGPTVALPRPARPTRADLYRRAQAAGIQGRSKMTKAQLERALGENRA